MSILNLHCKCISVASLMMMSWNENSLRVTGPIPRESTAHWWIPPQKATIDFGDFSWLAWGGGNSVKSILKSMLINKDFLTWLLIGWRLCCQPIRCQAWKSVFTNMDFHIPRSLNELCNWRWFVAMWGFIMINSWLESVSNVHLTSTYFAVNENTWCVCKFPCIWCIT